MVLQITSFLNIILKGIGQVMLQEKATTGILFLAGIFYGSVNMGIAAIVAACCGTLAAWVFRFEESEIKKGLYGFSPALVGVALILFFETTFNLWLLVIIGSIAAALIQHWFIKKRVPVFTLPFVLVTWLSIYLARELLHLTPALSVAINPAELDYSYAFKGYGQVIFQGNTASGILFFAGVFICSPVAALYGFFGSLLAGLLALWFGIPETEVAQGLYSFNAVLCAITFAGWKWKHVLWALLSMIAAVLMSMVMSYFKIIQLTFPFVAAACICTLLKKYVEEYFFKIMMR